MTSNSLLNTMVSNPSALRMTATPPPQYSPSAQLLQHYTDDDFTESPKSPSDGHVGGGDVYGSSCKWGDIYARITLWVCALVGVSWTTGLYIVYPAPSTVPLFIGLAFILTSWMIVSWTRLVLEVVQRKEGWEGIKSRYSIKLRVCLGLATTLVIWWIGISFLVEGEKEAPVMVGNEDKYFIAVNLHNNEAILPDFMKELRLLIFHLGRHDVFLSIYESNSGDETQALLHGFNQSMANLDVNHRILSVQDDPGGQWPYGTAPERIQFLAHARNMALEPLQSPDNSIRLPNWQEYTKIIFLNDIVFRWQDIVDLIATRVEGEEEGYDMACAIDYGSSGLYDTWVARDVCAAPLRAFWPFAYDKITQEAVRKEQPFEVAACWNGAVVIKAKPLLFPDNSNVPSSPNISARGWKSVDDVPSSNSRMSPPLTDPIRFRTSGVDACDHSECFLFSYDLHRYYRATEAGRRPRILMNPAVRVAYEDKWYHWNNVILRRPYIRWWLYFWSHGIGYRLFDWPFEHFGRRRDYCTWSGLNIPTLDERCPPLPGPATRHWNE